MIDLYLILNKCKILMYADDTVVFHSDKSAKAVEDVIKHEGDLVGNGSFETI